MSVNKKELGLVEPMKHESHAKPMTRRELLGQGFIAGMAYVAAPTILGILGRASWAEECRIDRSIPGLGSYGIPCLVIDCSGGISMASNFSVLKDELDAGSRPGYSTMGQPTGSKNNLDTTFGLPLFKGGSTQDRNDLTRSQILQGLMETTSASTRQFTKIGGFAARTMNDSGNNPINISPMVSETQIGAFIQKHVGTRRNSASGGNSRPVFPIEGSSLLVSKPNDLTSAIAGAAGVGSLNLEQRKRIAETVLKLTEAQRSQAELVPGGQALASITECAQKNNIVDINSSVDFDPTKDANANRIWKLDQGNIADDLNPGRRLRDASIIMSLMGRYTNSATIEVGGCDYHGRGRVEQNTKDNEVGKTIGRALEYASAVNQPIFISVISDGSISYDENSTEPRSDNRSNSYSVNILFKPGGVELRKFQVGKFTEKGVDTTQYIDNELRLGIAHFANWANASFGPGKAAELVKARLRSKSDFDMSKLDSILLFG